MGGQSNPLITVLPLAIVALGIYLVVAKPWRKRGVVAKEEQMESGPGRRQYGTAYNAAKIVEVLGWVVMLGGVLGGGALASGVDTAVGIGVGVAGVVIGLAFVLSAQLTLVVIDTEENTRRAAEELIKTNRMFAERLWNDSRRSEQHDGHVS